MRTLSAGILTAGLVAGSAIAATGQEEPLFGPMAPSRVSGDWVYEDVVSDGQVEHLGELMARTSGAVATYTVSSDDPRLSGTATASADWTGHYPPALVAVFETSWLIENDAGAWAGAHEFIASMADEDPINADAQIILEGSGAYEGLSAYLILSEMETFLGAIIPDAMPELPEDWLEIYQSEGEEGGAGEVD